MVSSITLGNLFTENGKQIISGGNTGLDTKALVDGLSDAKRLPAVKLEKSIELNTKKSEAYSTMKDILKRFQDSANFLRNPPGVSNSTENVFNYRDSTLTSNTTVAGSNYLSVDVQPGTPAQTFTVNEVTSLAKAKKQQTNSNFALASANDAVVVGFPGPGQLGAGVINVKGVGITLDVNDSLQTVANKFNAVKDTTGISASIVQVSTGNYKLIFTSTNTGLANDFDMSAPATMTDASGVFAQMGGFGTLQAADDARFTLDNVAITRSSNTISDVISGSTINLKQVTPPGTEVKLDVEQDKDLIKTAIINFVDSYNEFKLFVSKQTEINDDGTLKDTAVLANSSTMRTVLTQISSEMSKAVQGLVSTDPGTLGALGITFKDFPGDDENPLTRNILNVDEGKLAAAISASPEKIRKVFAFDMTSSSSNLSVFKRTNSLAITDFTVNIDQVGKIYTATYMEGGVPKTVNLDAKPLNGIAGLVLSGQAQTPLEGLQLIYAASTNETVTTHVSQGIGDRVYNMLERALDSTSGQVTVEINALKSSNDRMKLEIEKIDTMVAKFRDQMLEKFATLEKTIARINTILQSLTAQANAQNNNS